MKMSCGTCVNCYQVCHINLKHVVFVAAALKWPKSTNMGTVQSVGVFTGETTSQSADETNCQVKFSLSLFLFSSVKKKKKNSDVELWQVVFFLCKKSGGIQNNAAKFS